MAFKPDFIKVDKSTPPSMPVGGDFLPTGLIVNAALAVRYSFMSKEVLDFGKKFDYATRDLGTSEWKRYYFKDEAQATEASQLAGQQFGPTQYVVMQASTDSILNIADEYRGRFGDTLTYEIRITTLKSKKYRHEYHLLFLPSLVAAAAKALGTNISFGVDELNQAAARVRELTDSDKPPTTMVNGREIEISPDEAVFNDAFHWRMIGNPDAKENDDDGFLNSVLWKERARVWTALGEDDPKVYLPIGSEEAGERYKKVTTKSKALSDLLWWAMRDWQSPIWVRLVTVPNPYEDRRYEDKETGDHKRNNCLIIGEFFEDEKTARKAAQEELEGKAKRKAEASGEAQEPSSVPPLPSAYADYPDIWKGMVQKAKEAVPAGPPPVVLPKLETFIASEGGDQFGATAGELFAWYNHV